MNKRKENQDISDQNIWNVVELSTKSKEPMQLKTFHVQADFFFVKAKYSFLKKKT